MSGRHLSVSKQRRHRLSVWTIRVVFVTSLLGFWHYQTTIGGVSSFILPRIDDVVDRTAAMMMSREIWVNAIITIYTIMIAFFLAAFLGIVFGLLVARTDFRAKVFEPLLNFGYMVPFSVFYPLLTLWFGTGPSAKVVYGAMSAFFPVAINTVRGIQSVNPGLTALGRAYGASTLQIELQIKWGAALPLILAGVRLGAAICVICVIVGEMLASASGLGQLLTEAAHMYRVADTYALIAVLLVIVFVLHLGISHIRR